MARAVKSAHLETGRLRDAEAARGTLVAYYIVETSGRVTR